MLHSKRTQRSSTTTKHGLNLDKKNNPNIRFLALFAFLSISFFAPSSSTLATAAAIPIATSASASNSSHENHENGDAHVEGGQQQEDIHKKQHYLRRLPPDNDQNHSDPNPDSDPKLYPYQPPPPLHFDEDSKKPPPPDSDPTLHPYLPPPPRIPPPPPSDPKLHPYLHPDPKVVPISLPVPVPIPVETELKLNSNSNSDTSISFEKENDIYFLNLVERMKPHFLQTGSDSGGNDSETSTPAKQFFHLHHMKTGGTSLSSFISCGIRRYTKLKQHALIPKTKIKNYRLSECSHSDYIHCISNPDAYCNARIEEATVMTFCAPLAVTDYFQWSGSTDTSAGDVADVDVDNEENIDIASSTATSASITVPTDIIESPQSSSEAEVEIEIEHSETNHKMNTKPKQDQTKYTPSVTMLRNPIDRVWSMYRFQTNHCYKCHSLIDVYKNIDNGNIDQYNTGVCVPQLSNHITRNLLTNLTIDELNHDNSSMSEDEKVKDAIYSIRNRFTVVGIIERLKESIELFSYSFPWLSVDIRTSEYFQDWDMHLTGSGSSISGIGSGNKDPMICEYPHQNSSPSNNRCGENGSHMDLPAHPDEETKKAIMKHNLLDMQVYLAALDHFELQQRAMNWEEEEDFE
jgi:hypothetical protein